MFYKHPHPVKLNKHHDRTLIGMAEVMGQGVHIHDFGETWAREMAEIRPEEIYFFVELAPVDI